MRVTPLDHLAAVKALTHQGLKRPGIDWAALDKHRLALGELHCSDRIAFDPASSEAEAIEGLLSGLDWLTDLAKEAGLFERL